MLKQIRSHRSRNLKSWLAGLGCLVGWLAWLGLAWLAGWPGWLAAWLVGWLAGWSPSLSLTLSLSLKDQPVRPASQPVSQPGQPASQTSQPANQPARNLTPKNKKPKKPKNQKKPKKPKKPKNVRAFCVEKYYFTIFENKKEIQKARAFFGFLGFLVFGFFLVFGGFVVFGGVFGLLGSMCLFMFLIFSIVLEPKRVRLWLSKLN